MNKNKKFIFIAASLLFIIFALILPPSLKENTDSEKFQSGQNTNGSINEPDPDSGPYKKKQYLLGYAQCNFSEPWRADMNDRMKEAAAKHPEFELIIKDGMQDNNKQISDIESLIQKKCDLIFVSPNEAKPLKDAIESAYNSGIPIILLDRKIDGEAYTQYIGADNYDIGKKAGEWIAGYLGANGGNVVEISGSIGTSAQIDRHNGFQDVIKNYPNIKVIDSGSSDWLREKSIAVMEKMLKNNSNIDVVFAHNDPSAEGAYTAAKRVGAEKNMKFVGIDAQADPGGGISSVIEGRISVTYLYPSGAAEAIESAYKLLVRKETLEKNIRLDTLEITQSNAAEVLNRLQVKKQEK